MFHVEVFAEDEPHIRKAKREERDEKEVEKREWKIITFATTIIVSPAMYTRRLINECYIAARKSSRETMR